MLQDLRFHHNKNKSVLKYLSLKNSLENQLNFKPNNKKCNKNNNLNNNNSNSKLLVNIPSIK